MDVEKGTGEGGVSLFEAMDVRHSDVTRTGAVTVLHALHYTRSANKTHTHTHTYTHIHTHTHTHTNT